MLGVVFLRGKGTDLISGYNTASVEEKMKTDEKKLCRFMGKLMFALAACWLALAEGDTAADEGAHNAQRIAREGGRRAQMDAASAAYERLLQADKNR